MGDIVFNYPDLQQGGNVDEGNNCTVGIKDAGVQGNNRLLVNQVGRSPFVGTGIAMRFHKESSKISAFERQWPLIASATHSVLPVPVGSSALAGSESISAISQPPPEPGQLPSTPTAVDALFALVHRPRRKIELGLPLGNDLVMGSRPAWDSLENLA